MGEFRKVPVYIESEKNLSKLTIASGLVILNDSKVLLVRKVGSRIFQIPGGTLNFNESLTACAERELTEETSMKAKCVGDPFIYFAKINEVNYMLMFWRGEPESLNPTPQGEIEECIWADVDDLPDVYENVAAAVNHFVER